MLNIIEQAKLTRKIADLQRRVQRAEGYFSGVPLSTVRIGNAVITSAKIADGAITTAKIANATIESAKINDLNASKVTSGSLSAGRIGAGTITTAKLNVSTLSSISTNFGSVNAGTISGVTITGGIIRTASSGSRIEMSNSPERLIVYNGSDKRIEMGSGFIILYGTNALRLYDSGGSNQHGYVDASSTSFNMIANYSGGNSLMIRNPNGNITFSCYGDFEVVAGNGCGIGGTFPKTAILQTSKGYRAVNCVEAPEIHFFDFYDDEPDDLFLETIEDELTKFVCENGKKLAFAHRKGFKNTRFAQKTAIEYERNNRFYAT
jgi:hypothetical protein